MNDKLGDRMKDYESKSENSLFTHLPVIARMDGRAFHTFTKGLKRPYDEGMSNLMMETTKYLVEYTGAILGYTQSDEISLMFYRNTPESQIFFNGRPFKMVSMLASMTTLKFNWSMYKYLPDKALSLGIDDSINGWGLFDARVFNVPSEEEATNYFLWRELDATKNSISMAAQSVYSHNELQGKNSADKQEMLWQKGINWNAYPSFFKRGSYFQRVEVKRKFSPWERMQLPVNHEARKNPALEVVRHEVQRLELEPLLRIPNRVEVLFGREKVNA